MFNQWWRLCATRAILLVLYSSCTAKYAGTFFSFIMLSTVHVYLISLCHGAYEA